ncbi:hypothetical protein [Mesorhizobium sp. ORM16]|uniref:hypothetical protein n=1 Tax=Mesorhizobium sp. ORM16 TaxID=3376989 RepID=UPI0038578E74
MSEAKHTPGPWRIDAGYEGLVIIGKPAWKRSGEWCIATLDDLLGDHDDEAQANARLIAAAPDMLAALQAIVAKFDPAALVEKDLPHSDLADEMQAAFAAISRAGAKP